MASLAQVLVVRLRDLSRTQPALFAQVMRRDFMSLDQTDPLGRFAPPHLPTASLVGLLNFLLYPALIGVMRDGERVVGAALVAADRNTLSGYAESCDQQIAPAVRDDAVRSTAQEVLLWPDEHQRAVYLALKKKFESPSSGA